MPWDGIEEKVGVVEEYSHSDKKAKVRLTGILKDGDQIIIRSREDNLNHKDKTLSEGETARGPAVWIKVDGPAKEGDVVNKVLRGENVDWMKELRGVKERKPVRASGDEVKKELRGVKERKTARAGGDEVKKELRGVKKNGGCP